ncbi:molybdate ABC transporter permease subunit [Shewanella sp.]|uniref:molybdate ABC transporter permease subunit n=1 Tax=Shewanella sp. TaxID=50422 RepID=UPI003A96DD3D
MDWVALWLSGKLALVSVLILLPLALWLGRTLAYRQLFGKAWLEALIMIPLVLPPTVVGYYLLVGLGRESWLGAMLERYLDIQLVFHFSGLVIASIIINIPFAVQPIQRAFEAIPAELRDAAACCGMSRWRIFWRLELPLAWPGILTAFVLSFSHVLGEFGVVLMMGGAIAGETKTLSIAIYDRVQDLDYDAAGVMSMLLVLFAMVTLAITSAMSRRVVRQ